MNRTNITCIYELCNVPYIDGLFYLRFATFQAVDQPWIMQSTDIVQATVPTNDRILHCSVYHAYSMSLLNTFAIEFQLVDNHDRTNSALWTCKYIQHRNKINISWNYILPAHMPFVKSIIGVT